MKKLIATTCRYVISLFHIKVFKINVVINIYNGLNINKDNNNNISVKMSEALIIG